MWWWWWWRNWCPRAGSMSLARTKFHRSAFIICWKRGFADFTEQTCLVIPCLPIKQVLNYTSRTMCGLSVLLLKWGRCIKGKFHRSAFIICWKRGFADFTEQTCLVIPCLPIKQVLWLHQQNHMWIECFAAQMRVLHQRPAPIYQSDKKLLDERNYKTIIIGWITGSVKTVKKMLNAWGIIIY